MGPNDLDWYLLFIYYQLTNVFSFVELVILLLEPVLARLLISSPPQPSQSLLRLIQRTPQQIPRTKLQFQSPALSVTCNSISRKTTNIAGSLLPLSLVFLSGGSRYGMLGPGIFSAISIFTIHLYYCHPRLPPTGPNNSKAGGPSGLWLRWKQFGLTIVVPPEKTPGTL